MFGVFLTWCIWCVCDLVHIFLHTEHCAKSWRIRIRPKSDLIWGNRLNWVACRCLRSLDVAPINHQLNSNENQGMASYILIKLSFNQMLFPSIFILLAVQNSSIGDLVPWLVALLPLTIRVFTTLQSSPHCFAETTTSGVWSYSAAILYQVLIQPMLLLS